MVGAGFTRMLKDEVAELEFASVSCTTKLNVPEVVGVPDIKPDEPLSVNPLGRLPD
jgi:hypothetical protein